jgi:hypothetical protein
MLWKNSVLAPIYSYHVPRGLLDRRNAIHKLKAGFYPQQSCKIAPKYPWLLLQAHTSRLRRTSFLLLQRQLRPINLHAIPKRHPQLSLLLRWHRLPSLLDIRQRRVRDRMCLSSLDNRCWCRSYDGCSARASD